ncbi:amylo-alpha-1,6-glucosidase [uncultured Bacteroides sp.]|uniref:amylo-alpha-1,6-glucosidase n=1 Tax=uncultured Bacteroides sp. TaxID=162156 RepID=UPI002624280D|nr:amylo-alpha-1,6-glucosidase [uncultured Bacteroides sp.]
MNRHIFAITGISLVIAACTQSADIASPLDSLGVEVTSAENREYSFTDKKSGFWYGTTHQDSIFFWSGWNISKKRIFSDYKLSVDGKSLNRKQASCTVYPNKIVRVWNSARETFSLVDNYPVLYINLSEVNGDSIGISLNQDLLSESESNDNGLLFTPKENGDSRILLSPAADCGFTFTDNGIKAPVSSEGFIITCGNEEECEMLLGRFRSEGKEWLKERADRMSSLITEYNPISSNIKELDKAINWLTLTTDELVTEQQGMGIYAGLPWFNEYWGRDMFISMPGTCLVSGQFDVAKQILLDFAKFQDKNPESPTYGRIPNRANPDGILYNTTDGTPRFVIQAFELLEYSGDTAFVSEIYPAVKLSIDASCRNFTDDKGYLTHADADTWMDVKRNGIPGSPRGNRANDIQALWYGQLEAGSRLAELVGDKESAERWLRLASKIRSNFEHDYCDKEGNMVYDHLNSDGTPDKQFRPNQLYCFEMIGDEEFKKKVTRRCWEELTYPWGVASLAQWDTQFHPQHENWHYYHKDDAYHNGTVWLWNNGIAMQRMIEYGQVEAAWQLFRNMNRQALVEGAVGSLSENADAHPREGKSWVNRSGTFLQAWSNAEHLRVWYQYFLGIRPDMMNRVITIEPNLPKEIMSLQTSVKIGKGTLTYTYRDGKFDFRFDGDNAEIRFVEPKQINDPIFDGVEFCTPEPLPHYPCFDVYHDPALTY